MQLSHLNRLSMLVRRLGPLPESLAGDVRALSAEWEKTMRTNPSETEALLEPRAREMCRRIEAWAAEQRGVVPQPPGDQRAA